VSVASFPMATSETYKDRTTGEKRTVTEWHNIVLWRGLADVAEKYLQKGSLVYIEGKLKTRSWEDQDKNIRYTTEVVADSMTMLGRSRDAESEVKNSPSQPQDRPELPQDQEDDLPF
jgi:single-strand DNA-binding protein